ncbi:hypothetical protein L3Q82_002054 [Scortum barcoo]|uniref:Uncharacterized protein n=1 Tax=Scortum barcoo TaxID=214431 RepID=A0ACB8W1U4_9TELE|nr:hypothetical protein L3Q82_002054 [Scortum barcoo]
MSRGTVRASPTSSVISEEVWEDEEDKRAEEEDDFVSHMDENGIIGLSEALEDVELGETRGNAECEADSSGVEKDSPPEEPSYNSSEHLSHIESPLEAVLKLLPRDELMDSLQAWTVDEKVGQRREEQAVEHLHERDKYLDMTEEEKEREKAGKRSDRHGRKDEHSAHLLATEPAGVSDHHCPLTHPASPVAAPTFSHLLYFTAEEMAAAPGIEAETFPDMSFIESFSESHRSHTSPKSSPRTPETKLRASLQPVALFPEEVTSNHYSGASNGLLKGPVMSDKHLKQPIPLPRKTRPCSPEATYVRTRSSRTVRADSLKNRRTSPDREQRTTRAKNTAADQDESRKGPLSYRTPDFSKVEPKVRFPKGGYKPPKSRRSSKRDSLSPEPPLVFKSPADIVKEVLLNTTHWSPTPSDSYRPPTSAPNSTVPEEFRCRRQATTLLEQLQEDYNKLLTKYAEAENTIDRLRLEAKVNLYSDPLKPGHSVQSGPNQNASKFVTLDFPQAQRAEINPASLHLDGHSIHQGSSSAGPSARSPSPQVGQHLAKILYNQADKFLQQLQSFDDLLKSGKLQPFEQMKGLSQLAEGLDSLERGYLLTRDEHKLLQQRGAEISHFDPERELEGLIFQCGLRMDELKEQVEQTRQEQPACEAPPSPCPHPTPSSVPSEGGETLTHPQSPPMPLLVHPGEAAAVEVSSASEETHEEQAETEDEETLTSLYLRPLVGKHRRVEQDYDTLMDHYQSFKDLPKLLDHSWNERAPLSATIRTDLQPGDEGRESQGTVNPEVQRSLPQRKAKSDHQDSPPVHTSKQQASRSSPPSHRASSQSSTFPVHPPSSRRLEVGKSHSSSLSSLGEITSLERRNFKLQTGSSRVLSQDGIISPETDSGFVGSESSRLTPAAAPSPLHQRASESVSGPQEGKPQTGPVTAPSPACSSSDRCTMEAGGATQLSSDQPRRTRHGQRRRTFSCSPQRWATQAEQTRADSRTSEFGLESESTHSVSEDGQNDQHTESSLHCSSTSSSPSMRRHHGDSLRALSSSRVVNHNDAIQTLQAEVTRLKQTLEGCLTNNKPLSSVRAAPSAQENYSTSTPGVRSGERWSDVSRGRRDRQTVDEVDESTLRRTTRRRPSSAHRQKPQPDTLTGSEPSRLQPPPLVSRCTQTSAAALDSTYSHANTIHSTTHSNCLRATDSPTSCQPAKSPDRAARSRYFTAADPPPAVLQCMPVCPPPLLLYSSPLYVSPSNSAATSSGVRGRGEVRRKMRRSLSVDRQLSVDDSLNRAIRAARHMKHTSGHMARSLATGLQYQELLTQACSH